MGEYVMSGPSAAVGGDGLDPSVASGPKLIASRRGEPPKSGGVSMAGISTESPKQPAQSVEMAVGATVPDPRSSVYRHRWAGHARLASGFGEETVAQTIERLEAGARAGSDAAARELAVMRGRGGARKKARADHGRGAGAGRCGVDGGIPRCVEGTDAARNAIVPQVAAKFIQAYCEAMTQ